MIVHILATVLEPSRLKTQLLVFKSIRTGFPSATIHVYGNGMGGRRDPNAFALAHCATALNGQYQSIERVSHGEWLEHLLAIGREPFWVADGDLVFLDKVEDWFIDSHDVLFAGRYEPEFWEGWTKTIHVARLHPSLMWFNPAPLRAAIRAWPGQPEFFQTVQHNLIQWNVVPEAGKPLKFYDTCAGLHHALGGKWFTDEQNACYEHLFCGTYAHLMGGVHPNLPSKQDQICDNPQLARGIWKEQQSWYRFNAILKESRPMDSIERAAMEEIFYTNTTDGEAPTSTRGSARSSEDGSSLTRI